MVLFGYCMCDMRRANEAIIRERHHRRVATRSEWEYRVYSKLDLIWGSHQIMLNEESRHITTFVTHRELYRYRRLVLGTMSALEKYCTSK